MSAKKIIEAFAKKSLTKNRGSGIISLPSDFMAAEKAAQIELLLTRAGIPLEQIDDYIRTEADLLKYLNIIDATSQPTVYSGQAAMDQLNKLFPKKGEVFDLKGKKLDPSKPIMGGTQDDTVMGIMSQVNDRMTGINKANKKLGDLLRERQIMYGKATKTEKNPKIKEIKMFKEANERFNKTDVIADTVTKITSMEPVSAMKEVNKIIRREGIYKNLDETQSKKIITDTEDWIFQRDPTDLYDYKNKRPFRDDPNYDPDDPDFDPDNYAKGGRAGYQVGARVMPNVDARMNLDYDTLVSQNEAQRATQAQNRGIFSGPAFDKYSAERTRAYTQSPSRLQYNLDSNKAAGQFIQDKTMELLGDNPISRTIGGLGSLAAVPVAALATPFHEGIQVVKEGRMEPGSGAKGFYDAFMAERPFTTAAQRAGGVLQSVPFVGDTVEKAGEKAFDLVQSAKDLFKPTEAKAAETTPTPIEPKVDPDRILDILSQQKDAGVPEEGLITQLYKKATQDDYYAQNESAIRSGMMPAQRPTMADVAGPKMIDGVSQEGIIPGFKRQRTGPRGNYNEYSYVGPDGQTYGAETYASIAAGRYPKIYDPNKEDKEKFRLGIYAANEVDPKTNLYDIDSMYESYQQAPGAGFFSLPEMYQRFKQYYAGGGRARHYTGGMVDVEPSLSDIGHGSDSMMARTRLVSPNSQATTSTGLNYLLAEDNDNIRVPFSVGGSGRRAFLKLLAALGGGIAGIKTGILGLGGKEPAKQVAKEAVKSGAGQPPAYFFKLVDKIKTLGDDTLASQDNTIAKKYKDYVLEEDFAGNISIIKKDMDNPYPTEVIMSYKVDEVSLGKRGSAKVDDYEEFTARPDFDGKMKDIEGGVPDEVIEEAMEENIKLKADGGRIGFSAGGGLYNVLARLGITGSSRRFLEKAFGKENFENMIRNDPDMHRGLLEVVEMFRNRDKEGLKMYMQKFLPHMSDAEVEEFIIGSTPDIQGLTGQLIRLGSGRDYAGKLEMMKKADQVKQLQNFDIKNVTKNAEGGRIELKGGGDALKALLNYFAKEAGKKGSQQLRDINPKALPSGILNIMGPDHLKMLQKNQTDYLETLLDVIKSDKKFLDKNKELTQTMMKDAPEGFENEAQAIVKMMVEGAMGKGGRLDRLKVYDKIDINEAIVDIEQMIKNRRMKESDGRALNASGGLQRMLGE